MLGTRLKYLRTQKKLTQKQLAEKINVTHVSISGYESGNRSPDTDTLQRLADFFEVSTDYLLGRSDTPATPHGISKEEYANLSEEQKEVLDFFLNLDDLAFKEKPADILAALEQFELYYKLYKEQQTKKQK